MWPDIFLYALLGYLGVGFLFGLAFVSFGIGRIDAGARGSWPVFRLLILPGAIVLWPWVLTRFVSLLRRSRAQ